MRAGEEEAVKGEGMGQVRGDKPQAGARSVRCVQGAYPLYEGSVQILPTHLTLILHPSVPQTVKYVAFARRTCHQCSIFGAPPTSAPYLAA